MIKAKCIYCPVCFNDSLQLKDSGKINVFFNNRQHESAQFLFNLQTNSTSDIEKELTKVLNNYFKWYAEFQNRDPINSIEVTSVDFTCSSGCMIPSGVRVSVVGIIFSEELFTSITTDLAQAYSLEINL